MATWYPSAKIKLRVRLEEFGNPFKDAPSSEFKKPATTLKGVKDLDRADTLKFIENPESLPGTTSFLLVSKTTSLDNVRAAAESKTSSDGLTHEISGIIPIDATWKQNGIRAADTLTVKVRLIDFPIDPRCVRSCAIEFYLGCVSGEDYASGIGGELRLDGEGNGSGEPMHVVPDVYTDEKGRGRTNRRFIGWVDKWKLNMADGEPSVTFECRDNTQLFIKQEAPAKMVASAVSDDVPLDEAVAQYLAHFPQLEGIVVEYRPTRTAREDIPRLKKVLAQTAMVPTLGPQQSQGGGSGGGEKMTVWDYLTDICGALGHGVRVEDTTVIIQRASTMLRSRAEPRPDDPYEARTDDEGRTFDKRAFIYGRNITEVEFSREYNKKEPTNIEVRTYDPHRKTMIIARSPKDAAKRVDGKLPGDAKDKKWKVIHGPAGVRDKDTLQAYADEAYEQFACGELLATFKTKDLWSFMGDATDPDLLDMKAGDTFDIHLTRAGYSTMSEIEKAMNVPERAINMLHERLGFSQAFADAYAKCYADGGFEEAYKLREMTAHWSITEGVSLDIQAANYTTARLNQDPDKEPDDGKASTAVQPPKKTAPGGKRETTSVTDTTGFLPLPTDGGGSSSSSSGG